MGKQILYKTDEISATEIARREQQRRERGNHATAAQAVVKFLGGCRWNERLPAAWEDDHRRAEGATIFARQAETTTIVRNRPVPRSASCHYDRRTSDIADMQRLLRGLVPHRTTSAKTVVLTEDMNTFYFY